jgi:hypothetical protein
MERQWLRPRPLSQPLTVFKPTWPVLKQDDAKAWIGSSQGGAQRQPTIGPLGRFVFHEGLHLIGCPFF